MEPRDTRVHIVTGSVKAVLAEFFELAFVVGAGLVFGGMTAIGVAAGVGKLLKAIFA